MFCYLILENQLPILIEIFKIANFTALFLSFFTFFVDEKGARPPGSAPDAKLKLIYMTSHRSL